MLQNLFECKKLEGLKTIVVEVDSRTRRMMEVHIWSPVREKGSMEVNVESKARNVSLF